MHASIFVFAECGAFFKCLLHVYLTHVAMPTKILSVRVRTLLCVHASTPVCASVCVYKSPHLLYMAPPPAGSALSLRAYRDWAAAPRRILSLVVDILRGYYRATSFIALLFQSSKSHRAKGLSHRPGWVLSEWAHPPSSIVVNSMRPRIKEKRAAAFYWRWNARDWISRSLGPVSTWLLLLCNTCLYIAPLPGC